MRAVVAPKDHASYVAPEAVPLIRLVTAQEEGPARLHEGTVEIPRLEAALSHLTAEKRGRAETSSLFHEVNK